MTLELLARLRARARGVFWLNKKNVFDLMRE